MPPTSLMADAEILAEYAARDSRFVVVTKENGGLSDARNFGLGKAKGKYIIFVDGDDYIEPGYKAYDTKNVDLSGEINCTSS